MMAMSSVRARGGTRLVVQQPARCVQSRKSLKIEARSHRAGVGLMGTKAGMTTLYEEATGNAVVVTVIGFESPNYVTQKFTKEEHGYDAVQVGYKEVREKNIKKPELGHCNKAGTPPLRHLVEFKVKSAESLEGMDVGTKLDLSNFFEPEQLVDIAGMTIGKGFQGSIKRWGHARGPMTHGSKSHRQHGSIGSGSASPARVFPGLKQAGQMGHNRVTARRLRVLLVDPERNALVVRGSVPGKKGNLLEITPAKIVGVSI